MKKEFTIPVKKEHFRRLSDPLKKHDICYAFVPIADLPANFPLEPNPRAQDIKSRVSRAIGETLCENSEMFHHFNRGITLTADAEYDPSKQLLTLLFRNENQGVIDGGHTYAVINEHINHLTEDERPEAFVKLEILTGFYRHNWVPDLARARNTSAQVKEESLANLQGSFDWIKTTLKERPYFDKIAWRENEDEDEFPIGIREIISFLTMFHPDFKEPDNPPVIAYTSKGRCLQHFTSEENLNGYQRLIPIVNDILRLYDFIHLEFERMYRELGGFSGKKDVKLGKVVEVKVYKEGFPLYYLEKTTQFKFPSAWILPIVAAHRGIARYKGEKPVAWLHDPFEFFKEHGKKLVKATLETSQELGRNPNAQGKNKGFWTNLHSSVIFSYQKSKGLVEE